MDKLQPIIKNRFWILAGLLLPLAMYGFFSANSKLKAATADREKALDTVLSQVPGGTNDANEKYEEGLKKINEFYTKNVDQSIVGIWNKQQKRMTWPNVVKKHVPKKFLGDFDFSGVVAYKAAYEQQMKDLQARVEPVMPMENGRGLGGVPMIGGAGGPPKPADVPWQQKVVLAASIPQYEVKRIPPTSEEVWNAQIDIWMLRLLFDSVSRLNEDKDTATEAILRRIDRLELVGGDGEPVLTGGSSGGGEGSGGYGGEMAGLEGGPSGGSGGYGGSGGNEYGGGKTGGTKAVPIAFSPAQEFGSAADSSGDDDGGGSGGADSYGGGSGGAGGRNQKTLRYIAESEDAPFLERGFYMSVIIMQDKIPDFLVELADSEWPVRVIRYHVGKNPYYSEKRTGGGFNPGFGSGEEFGAGPLPSDTFGGGGSGAGYGGPEGALGGTGAKTGIPGVGNLVQNLPEFADAAMQNSNLVQLDLLGVITMYKQPQIVIDAIDNQSENADAGGQQGGEPALPGSGDAPATTEELAPAADEPAATDATTEAAGSSEENDETSELEKL